MPRSYQKGAACVPWAGGTVGARGLKIASSLPPPPRSPRARRATAAAVGRVAISPREPYRRNAILWLEHCTRQPLPNFQQDLHQFMEGLTPSVREEFVIQTKMVLEDAVRYFGGVG